MPSGPAERVLYVLRYWPTVSETFVAGEIDALARSGVQVTVLSMGTRADAALAPPSAAETLHLPRGARLAGVAWRHPGLSKRAVRLRWAARQARVRGITRVHAHFAGEAAVFARSLAGRLGVPWSVTVHAVDLFRPIPGLSPLLAAASPVIAVCEHHRTWIARRYRVDAAVVRCGIDVEGRPLADPSREPARVVCVARDVEKKGLDRLRRAVPAARLDLVGADGPVPPDRIPDRLAAAQLFALPARVATNGDRDGVPVAMMEAMAAGLPVVTRPVSGIPELVDDTVGWIDTDFERALTAALADPVARAAKGAAARRRVAAHWARSDSVRALVRAWDRVRP